MATRHTQMSVVYRLNEPDFFSNVWHRATISAMKPHYTQSLEDLAFIWEWACNDNWNKAACREYNSIFVAKALETIDYDDPDEEAERKKRSYCDARSRYLHLSTLDEMMARGYGGYIGSTGNMIISKLLCDKPPWWFKTINSTEPLP